MRVLVLGAAGRSGREVAARLGRMCGVARVYLADGDAEALCRVASDLDGLPVSTRYLDVEDEDCLLERMSEVDLAVGCVGPCHLHEERIASAALRSGCDYLSLCDDAEAARSLHALSSEAERRGVRILCGCGMIPGISNLLACRAASHLDDVRALSIAWFLRFSPALGSAALAHILHAYGGRAPALRSGSITAVRAGSWPEEVHFPPPVGWREVSLFAHPEPWSLSRVLPGLKEADLRAGFGDRGVHLALQSLAWLCGDEQAWPRREAALAVAGAMARRKSGNVLSSVVVRAEGRRRGMPARRVLAIAGDYYRVTGAAVTAALEYMLADGWAPGVRFPEEVMDGPAAFERLRELGLRVMVGE